MRKIETVKSDLSQAVRLLQGDELDAVNGGFGFVERAPLLLTTGPVYCPPPPPSTPYAGPFTVASLGS
jgi:hypothetical protein